MIQLLTAVPDLVFYGCIALAAFMLAVLLRLVSRWLRLRSQIRCLTGVLEMCGEGDYLRRRNGLALDQFDELRLKCGTLQAPPGDWWNSLESHVEPYKSRDEIEGWFLTEQPRQILPYEVVIGRQFDTGFFGAVPGLLTGGGLALTFVAILLALWGVHYDKGNTADPITGIDVLINGLSGKFLSSIAGLAASIVFTLCEKKAVRSLRLQYEGLIFSIGAALPYLSASRVLLDIQRSAAEQSVSVSHISSEVVDRLVGSFNSKIVPALADGMSSGVAEKMQNQFRPAMQYMNDTLEELKAAIVRLEAQRQEWVTGELRGLLASLETSLAQSLSKMGEDFHVALSGAATKEFGNVQGTLEATRTMLSDMNSQFGATQAAFSTVVAKAEQATTDQMKTGQEQTEALTGLMNGLMTRLQESADQNLSNVRAQLTTVVVDLTDKVGTLSREMMTAAENVAKHSQAAVNEVLVQTGDWSEATARRLEALLSNIETRSNEFQTAGHSLMKARDFLAEIIGQNAVALERMADASRQVHACTTGLAGQTDSLKSLSLLHSEVTSQLQETSVSLRASLEQSEASLSEYRRNIGEYRAVIERLDESLGRILGTIHGGLKDYNESIENNFREIVKISNPMISEASSFLQTQIDELSDRLEELGSVISSSMERVNGRAK